MHEPYLAIYVQNDKLSFSKKLPTEKESREIFWVDIEDVISIEAEEASKKVGGTVLGILRLWHPDIFNDPNRQQIKDDAETQVVSDFDIAMQLISKSVSDKTKVHVPSIDALLREQSQRTKAAHEFFNESWPAIRARLEKFS
jgi:hypothetical protein